ncbi:MAG: hypothetical protein H6702_13600 [Myxococcales bacterium]|nr:hypothetical protein [Myxococcales bacterium]
MRRVRWGLALAAVAALGCGETDAVAPPSGASAGAAGPQHTAAGALVLAPDVRLVGLGDIFDQLQVTHLSFDAELFLLPEGDGDPASVAVRYTFDDEDGPSTRLLADPLSLTEPGRYQLLVRIRPNADDGVAVRVAGAVDGELAAVVARAKDDAEPAPTPAEPAPTPAEPAPTPADDPDGPQEPAPTPAEPAPTPAEPAPTPASDPAAPVDEPAPTPAEPAPTPAREAGDEPAPTPAREKGDGPVAGGDGRETVFVRSTSAHEFFAGTVEVDAADRTLVVTWDARRWLRSMLAQPLGLDRSAEPVEQVPEETGFQRNAGGDFRLDTH